MGGGHLGREKIILKDEDGKKNGKIVRRRTKPHPRLPN